MKISRINPVIVKTKQEPWSDPQWIFELKYDGFRGVFHSDGGKCMFVSKTGKILSFPNLSKTLLGQLGEEPVILDGEIVCLNAEGRPIFDNLMKRRGGISFVAFDILQIGDKDLRNLPLKERRKILEKFARKKKLQISFAVVGRGEELFAAVVKNDLEGMVGKSLEQTYGRHTRWYKVKNKTYTQEQNRKRLFAQRNSRN